MIDIKVSFPEPCTELWDAMAPRGCNRHCPSCDKIIHDLEALTVEEAEALIEQNDEVCVRARISADGLVRTANGISTGSRRIVTAIGASLTLATAACQTNGTPAISPRYEIKGHVQNGWAWNATLLSSSGKSYSRELRSDQNFRFTNLRPGIYTLSFTGSCYEVHRIENLIIKNDTDLGNVIITDQEDCIIIGRIERTPNVRQG